MRGIMYCSLNLFLGLEIYNSENNSIHTCIHVQIKVKRLMMGSHVCIKVSGIR